VRRAPPEGGFVILRKLWGKEGAAGSRCSGRPPSSADGLAAALPPEPCWWIKDIEQGHRPALRQQTSKRCGSALDWAAPIACLDWVTHRAAHPRTKGRRARPASRLIHLMSSFWPCFGISAACCSADYVQASGGHLQITTIDLRADHLRSELVSSPGAQMPMPAGLSH